MFAGRSKERVIQFIEQPSLRIMSSDLNSIVFKHLNLITSEALGGTCVEVYSILITFDRYTHFAPLFPVQEFFFHSSADDGNNNKAEVAFHGVEGSLFLSRVREGDYNFAVSLPLGDRTVMFAPLLRSSARPFQFDEKGESSVRRGVPKVPSSVNGILKAGEKSPSILKAK